MKQKSPYSIAAGYGKYVVIFDDSLHTWSGSTRKELGIFSTLKEAEAFINARKEEDSVARIVAEWKEAIASCV